MNKEEKLKISKMLKEKDIDDKLEIYLSPDLYCYVHNYIVGLKNANNQLTNNWNELEEWLKEQKEDANKCIEWNKNKNQYYDEYKRDIARFDFVLDKMKEIKEENK